MSLFLLPICYFLRNGVTVDDLGLILVGGAMVILMGGVTCRAVRVIAARLIIPAADFVFNVLVGAVPDQEAGDAVDIEDLTILAPDDPVVDLEA